MDHAAGATDGLFTAVLSWRAMDTQQEIYLREGDIVQIGRGQDNDLQLADGRISRHHAVIQWRDGHFEISDLGSTNGVEINGEKITWPERLADGTTVCIGGIEVHFNHIPPVLSVAELDKGQTFVVLPDTPQPRLIISAGQQEGREIRLGGHEMTIGRTSNAGQAWDISLPDRSISRPHARLEHAGGHFVLVDLGSANGTMVNGEAIQEMTTLEDGDVILLGETTMLFRER